MKIDGMVELRNKMMRVLSHHAVGSRWLHVKTDREYTIIGKCRLEGTNAPAYLYVGDDEIVWARDMDEFLDGRFVKIEEGISE